MHTMQVGQLERHRRLLDEGRFLAHGIHASHIHRGAADGEHHARQAAARAHIQQTHRPRQARLRHMAAQRRHGGQAVEQVVREHFLRVTHGRQVVHLVPLLQQREELQQTQELRIVQPQRQRLGTRAQALHQHIAHATTPSSARTKPLKPPFFRCTNNSEIAAGVTPEIREAWPSVSGRCFCSACRTSIDNAVTWR